MRFSQALADAVARGVEVRVLVDDAGAPYSWPTILPVLRRTGVPCATFLPTFAVWRYRATHSTSNVITPSWAENWRLL